MQTGIKIPSAATSPPSRSSRRRTTRSRSPARSSTRRAASPLTSAPGCSMPPAGRCRSSSPAAAPPAACPARTSGATFPATACYPPSRWAALPERKLCAFYDDHVEVRGPQPLGARFLVLGGVVEALRRLHRRILGDHDALVGDPA